MKKYKLLSKGLKRRFREIGKQSKSHDPIVIAKFNESVGQAFWYATEYDSQKRLFYGYVNGPYIKSEWMTFSIDFLEALKEPYSMGVERDLSFKEAPISQIIPELKREMELKRLQKKLRSRDYEI